MRDLTNYVFIYLLTTNQPEAKFHTVPAALRNTLKNEAHLRTDKSALAAVRIKPDDHLPNGNRIMLLADIFYPTVRSFFLFPEWC